MQSVGSSSAHFENAFASAGINQTRHEIRLVVDVVSVLLPGFSTVTKVTNRCAVAETVIVGSVPDTYTYALRHTRGYVLHRRGLHYEQRRIKGENATSSARPAMSCRMISTELS